MTDLDNMIAALNNAGLCEVPPEKYDGEIDTFTVKPVTPQGATILRASPERGSFLVMEWAFDASGKCEGVSLDEMWREPR